MSDAEYDGRSTLVAASRKAVVLRLNTGTVGNFSLRHGEGMLITPTGIPPDDLTPEHIVAMDMAGHWTGRFRPSSEWEIHARVYQTTAAGAVVHAHPDHSVALSSLRLPILPFHYMVAGFGGDVVPCASYETFGTPALADAVVAALGATYSGCLMANHGIVTHGRDMQTALARADKLEALARQYLMALSAGAPILLTPAEMAGVHARYGSYGQQPDT